MMNARDELAEVLHDNITDDLPANPFRREIQQQVEQAVDVLIAAGYSKPRQVSTVAELDALADNSVIEDSAGDVGVLMAGNVWYPETAPIPVRKVGKSYIPATVLYQPATPDAPTETGI